MIPAPSQSSLSTEFGATGSADSGITLLHVDDDRGFADLVQTWLQREHEAMTVLSEATASDALDRLREVDGDIDCVVSDYQMPGTDGIEFLRAVREDYPDLPFILFTGKGSEAVAGTAISAGVTDYLQKRGGTDQFGILANRVENVVSKARSERRVRDLLHATETAREGISLLDDAGVFVYANPAYAAMHGVTVEELSGEHWASLYPGGDARQRLEAAFASATTGGDPEVETARVGANGSTDRIDHALSHTSTGRTVWNTRVVCDSDNTAVPLSAVVDALDDLLFFFDEDGALQYWNDAVEAVTGRDPAELATMKPTDFVREADREAMDAYLDRAIETGTARVEVQLRQPDGDPIPYEFISREVTAGGEIVGRVGVGRDISTRTEYEARIERQNERLEHFAEVLSHDLRNPLTVAKGHLDLLHESGNDDHYETARRALARIDALISDVLTLAQTGENISLDEYETVELADVAALAWGLVGDDPDALDVVESAPVAADASRLQQILENLFRNTVEHALADEDGSPAPVSIRVGLLADGAGFYVEDDGPGIPEADRDTVFEPGYSSKRDGTGFGLATVSQLADAHDWQVTVCESQRGGTRFEFTGVAFTDDSAPADTG